MRPIGYDKGSLAVDTFEKTLIHETAHGLSDGYLADAEQATQLRFGGNPTAGLPLPPANPLPEVMLELDIEFSRIQSVYAHCPMSLVPRVWLLFRRPTKGVIIMT